MSTLEIGVVEAFRSLGVAPEVAMRAAAALHARDRERMSTTDTSIGDIKSDIRDLRADVRDIRGDVSDLQTDVGLLKWMVGFALVILVTLLGKAIIT